jgi:enoyl-CoA hydratase/carnithine racemase
MNDLVLIYTIHSGGRVTMSIFHCRKPTIGALQGSAVGIGITMTLPMNIRIAYRGAKIGFVFSRRGLVMEACSSYFLPRLVGHSRAMQAITTGATYLADDKVWDGLFSDLVDSPEGVLPRALEIAEDVVRNTSSVSTYLMKEMMFRDAGSPEGQHLLDSRVIYELFGSPLVLLHRGFGNGANMRAEIIPRVCSRSCRRDRQTSQGPWIIQRSQAILGGCH